MIYLVALAALSVISRFDGQARAAGEEIPGGAVPLKLAGLALWTTGIAFLFLARSARLGSRRSFWIAATDT